MIEAAKTKPFGFMAFYPGPGLGGHCIPLDPFYLAWTATEHGMWARSSSCGEVNTLMPRHVVDRTVAAVNQAAKSIVGAKILVLGSLVQPNVDDDRESPSFEIIELLQERGAVVAYCDRFVPTARRGRKQDLGLSSAPCTAPEFANDRRLQHGLVRRSRAQWNRQSDAARLAREGAHVVVTDVDAEAASAVAAAIVAEHGLRRGLAYHLDVADEASVHAVFERIVANTAVST